MAFEDNNENNQNGKVTASDFLPRFFRTNANKKFLQATLDQLIQPGEAEKIQGYFGRRTAKAFTASDNYISDVTDSRQNYQLEPALVSKDEFDNVTFYKDYNDYVNQLGVFGADIRDHSKLNSQETYPWNPNIDWDKFVNFREYYWLPNGPQTVGVRGQAKEVTSTFTVTSVTEDDNDAYLFNDGLTRNPTLQLYRGQTYRFEVDVPGNPIAFSISRTFTPGSAILTAGSEGIRSNGLYDSGLFDEQSANYDLGEFIVLPSGGTVSFDEDENVSTLYPDGIRKFGEEGEEVATVYLEKGTIEFTVPENAPERLYYISKNNVDTSGYIKVADIEENTFLDVTQDILGKKTYTSANGVEFTNGLKVKFQGSIVPDTYESSEWYVEGVGQNIKLIRDSDLIIPAAYADQLLIPFDTDSFDTLPFADANSYTADKDYICISRASQDKNAWSRYNKWFHKSIVEKSIEYNQTENTVSETQRAKRPIIEFNAGLKLNNYGSKAKTDITLIDTVTQDVFSNIEGQVGYRVDGVELADNMRVLFTADPDTLVNGKIYIVKFTTIGNTRQIKLIESEDTLPIELETVLVTQGRKNAGKSYHYHKDAWLLAQEKTKTNQPPLFDVYGVDKNSFSDIEYYNATTFIGTKLFSYKEGTGSNDTELGFPLSYRNINNSGDIVFEFNLLTDTFTYEQDTDYLQKPINPGFLKKYNGLSTFEWVNGFSSKPTKSLQKVLRQYIVDQSELKRFEIDVYDNAASLTDLKVNVFVNNSLTNEYTLLSDDKQTFVLFNNDLEINDSVLIKTISSAKKNVNGYYDFPINLERNPKNEDFKDFTLGEVIDHVDTMIEDITNFTGIYPGVSNLRDLGNVNNFGKRFVKHAGPINLSAYHVTSKNYNLVKALNYSRREYSRFKRNFLDKAQGLGIDTEVKQHVDAILTDLNKDRVKTEPFYFSDGFGYQAANIIEYTILDTRTRSYALTEVFDIEALTSKSVNAYINGKQLTYGVDYDFSNPGFIDVFADFIQEDDQLTIYEYETTDGTFLPPTPTKLGLYPEYVPEATYDDTYRPAAGVVPIDGTPYKIYAESEEGYNGAGKLGWFYPLYTTLSAAESKDSASGGTGLAHKHMFKGTNIILYMPDTGSVHAGVESTLYDAYPIGQTMIRGHDGSYIRCYTDFRDDLLLELEKRIFNNIKVRYNPDILNVDKFIGGEFRKSDYSREEIDSVLLRDFADWLTYLNNDYSDHYFYLRQDDFTFNYSSMKAYTGSSIPGFWRGMYKHIFDTDRPHTHPWEMIGFTIKPTWWNTVYGPAPYTGDNLLLWEDLEEGKIAEPGKVRYNSNYARTNLTQHIPVDRYGNLLSPLDCNLLDNFILRPTSDNFSFGDHAPVETAWRRSSEYGFAVLAAMILNKPAETIGLGFDVSRIQRNFANQYIYNPTSKTITLSDLVFPNTVESNKRIMTSGLVNYISNLVSSNVLKVYTDYTNEVRSISNQLGVKLGGFTDKDKVNIMLDSRSIVENQSQDGVFVPKENYDVFLNTSSPTALVTYSGIIVEKIATGFIVRGYSKDNPYFDYYKPSGSSSSANITVGGISEQTSEWRERTIYDKGQIIEYLGKFYRVTEGFTSGSAFNTESVASLPSLPFVDGKTANFKKDFLKTTIYRIPYGHKFATSQEVVDFILGYSSRLSTIGFDFNYTIDGSQVDDWKDSAKEFLFWTTQGWASGTTISLSPAANRLSFEQDYVVVDSLDDPFYTYSLYSQDGETLDLKFNSVLRDGNSFGIETSNTDLGVFHVALPTVQKEHVLLFDNKTVFNDIIYQPYTGYRQERIKVNAYRSDNWQGGFNVPGFVFDNAEYSSWEEYKDYQIGDLVKYRQYYYTAIENIPGTNVFNDAVWFRLSKEPEKKLLTNFDYKINQFMDFYDLDSAGFDQTQQELAQHLIGYQKRQYLANIINDDVSQFKFYNGFIQDKGTMNAVTKLFDSLSGNNENKLELFEEWAIQVGRYGSVDNEKQIEYKLTDSKIEEAPQVFELTQSSNKEIDKIYRLYPDDVYDKFDGYNHLSAFPVTTPLPELKTGGYVNEKDVTFIAYDKSELQTADINQIRLGSYVWLIETGADDWTVYQLVNTNIQATTFEGNTGRFSDDNLPLAQLTINQWAAGKLEPGELFGVLNATASKLDGIYSVDSTELDNVYFSTGDPSVTNFSETLFPIVKFREVRIERTSVINDIIKEGQYENQRFWVDNAGSGSWEVLENNPVYSNRQTLINDSDWDSSIQEYAKTIAVTDNNRTLVIGAPGDNNGRLTIYSRSRENSNFVLDQDIELLSDDGFDTADARFGETIDISPDGEYLVVGIPNASNVKTKFKGEFNPLTTYTKNDIVTFRESIWQALQTINPQTSSQGFTTFNDYQTIIADQDTDSTETTLLVSGDPGLENNFVDHILVRAPLDMYLGTKGRDFTQTRSSGVYTGDFVNLYWNQRSYLNPTTDNYLPFGGNLTGITGNFIKDQHEIIYKVDYIINIETYIALPVIGDFVTTITGRAEVVYVSTNNDKAVIYVKDTNGEFAINGELFVEDTDFIGLYSLENTYTTSTQLGGYWLIKTYNDGQAPATTFTSELSDSNGFTYNNQTTWYDIGRGMVYADVLLAEEWAVEETRPTPNAYYNVQNTLGEIGAYVNATNRASYLTQLSYVGDPTDADGQDGTDVVRETNLWIARVGRSFSDITNISDTVSLKLFDDEPRNIDYLNSFLTPNIVNINQQPVFDKWDGYIEFTLSRFDALGFAFQPQAKYYHSGSTMLTRTQGDVIVDVQTPSDGSGGLSVSPLASTSAAEVMYIQRDFNAVKVYLKLLTEHDGVTYSGTFGQLNNIGKYELKRLSNTDLRGATDVDRVFGEVTDTLNQIALGTSLVGQLLVFQQPGTFSNTLYSWPETPALIDEEYYFFTSAENEGIPLVANPPYSLNKDYRQIYNIPVDPFGTSNNLVNEGVVSIYRKKAGEYTKQITIASLTPVANNRFGSKVQIEQTNNFYTMLIGAQGNGTKEHSGSIDIYNNGIVEGPGTKYSGVFQIRAYEAGEIVLYKDLYYEARRDIALSTITPENAIYWNNISWRAAKDVNYRGAWDNTYSYAEDNIVTREKTKITLSNIIGTLVAGEEITFKSIDDSTIITKTIESLEDTNSIIIDGNAISQFASFDYTPASITTASGATAQSITNVVLTKKLYKALTNIDKLDIWNNTSWDPVNTKIDYTGVLPNLTGTQLYQEGIFDPATDILEFAETFDISNDAEIIIVRANLVASDSTTRKRVIVYRKVDNKYQVDQIIKSPNDNTSWGDQISLNTQGDKFVISAKTDNTTGINKGLVFVYKLIDGTFVLSQTLSSPQNEISEKFGYALHFGSENLLITSLNGDQKIPTTFDGTSVGNATANTTFDNGFTDFSNIKIDKGVVYVYEDYNDSITYAEKIIYPDIQTFFGESLYNISNHIYVGMPSQTTGDYRGQVINFRKDVGTTAWTSLDKIVKPVDLEKINGVTLYNSRTNEFITRLDYIDPLQGKIPGPAEQEIDYKLGFDPAVYNTGLVSDFLVDPARYWGKEHVGETWWATNTCRFEYAYKGTSNDQKKNWSKIISGTEVDIFEWVESSYIPEVWNEFADTTDGLAQGISGQALYGNTRYTTQLVFDKVAQTFKAKYYFWVQDKRTIPNGYKPKRKLNIIDIASLISNPRQQGFKYISFISENKFILNNCNDLIQGDDVVLQIRYIEDLDNTINRHNEYQIVSEGLESSVLNPDIERKWYDSLIGFDENLRTVPDIAIPANKRYGIQNKPRQSLFKNRFEALKQTVERANIVLGKELLIDSYNLSGLLQKESAPTESSNKYDLVIDDDSDLRFVSTNKVQQAELKLIISNGTIISANIVNPGRGYKVAPTYQIEGVGTGALIRFTINNIGQITDVIVDNGGTGYLDTSKIVVRPFSVLIKANSELFGKWNISSWNGTSWYIRSLQDYDVSIYWDYVDWYAEGYNQFTTINYNIEGTYLLPSLQDSIGSVIKVLSTGTGGWMLLQKVGVVDTDDYTQNYKVIGRENGTIKFKDTLYNYGTNNIGFDNRSFDSFFYDNNPAKELRFILQELRDNILIGNLKSEYNNLFFVGARYVLAEQKSADWLFKTSFVKAKYNVSELRNDVTFNSDNLESFEDYLKEVKPYKTKIREYINVYDKVDPTNTSITDFDLPPYYSIVDGKIIPNRAVITDGVIQNSTDEFDTYPRKNYIENVGFEINEIKIKDGGSGYTFEPKVVITGESTRPATARAYLGYGKVTSIKITDPGKGYLVAPVVTIEGSRLETGTDAKVSPILGNSKVRTANMKVKFDRLNRTVFIEQLNETETFAGTNVTSNFDLEWPIDLNRKKVKVTIDGKEMLRSTYTYKNVDNDDKTYSRQNGRISFVNAPKSNAVIVVTYSKPVEMLSAIDRIHHFYEPISGMYGKDFAQLMSGIDYGGVEVRSIDFTGPSGFDTAGWYTDPWDVYDNTYEDEVFTADGSTIAVQLNVPLENGIVYNLYKNGVRIDDPNFIAGTPTNVNAITNSITGDGTTDIIYVQDLGISLLDGDLFIVRKTTSDGSIAPDVTTYDTQLGGGDLPYATAKGVNAEEIIVDGDGFLNPVTNAGPEELVPGLITDALDIKVYTRDGDGNGVIYSQSYTTNGTQTIFNLGTTPSTNSAIFVKINDILVSNDDYTVNYKDNILTLNTAPAANQELNIISQSIGTDDLLDYGKFVTDGSTTEIITTVDWIDGASVSASLDGEPVQVVVFNSKEQGYVLPNAKVGIRFDEVILPERVIHYAVFSNSDAINYSRVITNTRTGDGTTSAYVLDDVPFVSIPLEHKLLVKVGNNILNPGYNIKYTIPENNQRTYNFEKFQHPPGTLDVQELKVFLNGVEIYNPVQWRYDVANASILLTSDTGIPGDTVEIYAVADGEYAFGYLNAENTWIDTPGTLHLDTAPALGEEVTIYQFSNHDIVGIERINYDVVSRIVINSDSENATYRALTSGIINLRSPAVDAQYVWVTKNNELLTPSVDYYVTDDKLKVRLTSTPAQDDVIDILHFTAPVGTTKFAYRQFKDMLNRTHYKRLDKAEVTLREDLNYYDQRIEVTQGSLLAEPNKGRNLPGIIWINGERIEYFVKEENTLRQIRRSTLGTGIKDMHTAGSKVYDQDISKTIPYQDNTISKSFIADGLLTTFEPGFSIANIDEVEVFVGGTRLRKSSITTFNPVLAQDSPEGDTESAAEFSVNNNVVTIVDTPADETQVMIVKKTGTLWSDQGTQLALTDNSIGTFLRAGTSELPE